MKPAFASLVIATAAATGLTRKTTSDVLRIFFAELANAVWEHGRVSVPTLGVFRTRMRKSRRLLIPQTGELMTLPGGQAVVFRASSRWRRR